MNQISTADARGVNTNETGRVSLVRITIAAAVAAVLNLAILWFGSAAGASLAVAAPEPINATTVVLMTLAPLLLAGIVVWFLERRYALRVFAGWAGLVFALVTIAGSVLAAADIATALMLASMHVVAGVAWFVALMPWSRHPAQSGAL